ncbi:conserved hypothetical protein [Gammaproteobacteria bacterium]
MTTLLIVGDLHINSTVAICPPEFELDDGGTYHQSPGQAWIWDNWQTFLGVTSGVKDLVTIFNGDLCEGDFKGRSDQLITRNTATIARMTSEVIDPLVKMSKAVYIIRGTEAHTGRNGALEETIARDFDLQGQTPNTHSWYTMLLSVSGRRFDIAHEVSGGFGTPLTRKNRANRLAFDTLTEYADRGEKPPDFVIRSHIHGMGDSYDNHITRGIITPCWTLATSYVNHKAPNAIADIGAVFIHIDDRGKTDVWKFNPKPRKTQWMILPYSKN